MTLFDIHYRIHVWHLVRRIKKLVKHTDSILHWMSYNRVSIICLIRTYVYKYILSTLGYIMHNNVWSESTIRGFSRLDYLPLLVPSRPKAYTYFVIGLCFKTCSFVCEIIPWMKKTPFDIGKMISIRIIFINTAVARSWIYILIHDSATFLYT